MGISKVLQWFCWVAYYICLEGLSYWRLQVNSDGSTTRVSFQFALYVFLSQRENSTLDQDSLSNLSHAHLFFSGSWTHSSESCCYCWSRASSLWLVQKDDSGLQTYGWQSLHSLLVNVKYNNIKLLAAWQGFQGQLPLNLFCLLRILQGRQIFNPYLCCLLPFQLSLWCCLKAMSPLRILL